MHGIQVGENSQSFFTQSFGWISGQKPVIVQADHVSKRACISRRKRYVMRIVIAGDHWTFFKCGQDIVQMANTKAFGRACHVGYIFCNIVSRNCRYNGRPFG